MSRMTISDWDTFAKWTKHPFSYVKAAALCEAYFLSVHFQDKSGVDVINATKEIYHLPTRIHTFVSHFERSNGCQLRKCFDNLGHIWSLCRIFLQLHTMQILATIKRRGNNRTVSFLFARYDVILDRPFN